MKVAKAVAVPVNLENGVKTAAAGRVTASGFHKAPEL